jgi:hypothetical protein
VNHQANRSLGFLDKTEQRTLTQPEYNMPEITFNNEGKALTESQDGVTMPIDYSFTNVNDFVHSSGTHFEDLQNLCLGMANEIEKSKKEPTKGELDNVFVMAARYAHNRQTGAAHQVVSIILKHWKLIQDRTKVQIAKEAKNEAQYNREDWNRIIKLYFDT